MAKTEPVTWFKALFIFTAEGKKYEHTHTRTNTITVRPNLCVRAMCFFFQAKNIDWCCLRQKKRSIQDISSRFDIAKINSQHIEIWLIGFVKRLIGLCGVRLVMFNMVTWLKIFGSADDTLCGRNAFLFYRQFDLISVASRCELSWYKSLELWAENRFMFI